MAFGHGLDHKFLRNSNKLRAYIHGLVETGKWHEVESLDEFRFQEIRIFCLHLFIDNRFKSSNYSAQRPFLLATCMTSYIYVLWGAFQFLGQP